MAKPKLKVMRVLRVKRDDDLKTIYAKAKQAFSAGDLQRYTDLKPGVSGDLVLAELEAIHREESRKSLRRKKA